MKFILGMLAVGLLSMATQSAIAADASALAQKGGCMACHGIDKKILGPSFKDVASKYKGQKDAEDAYMKNLGYEIMELPTGQGLVVKR